jgi:hypothetical protein
MPASWRAHSIEVYGEVREMTPIRERYVATKIIQKWLDQGLDAKAIALRWNAGGAKQCSSGVNRYGVSYDSCAYQQKVLAMLR